jgi:hypothetical protein
VRLPPVLTWVGASFRSKITRGLERWARGKNRASDAQPYRRARTRNPGETGCDLIWLRQTPFRLVRKSAEEPWRGTLCQIENESYLFTTGYVPWWDEFPGAHIPAPLEIGSAGPTDIEARSREILTLSKMNWNSSDGITRLPVTLLFAKKVGEVMTELSDNATPNESFRFHT